MQPQLMDCSQKTERLEFSTYNVAVVEQDGKNLVRSVCFEDPVVQLVPQTRLPPWSIIVVAQVMVVVVHAPGKICMVWRLGKAHIFGAEQGNFLLISGDLFQIK